MEIRDQTCRELIVSRVLKNLFLGVPSCQSCPIPVRTILLSMGMHQNFSRIHRSPQIPTATRCIWSCMALSHSWHVQLWLRSTTYRGTWKQTTSRMAGSMVKRTMLTSVFGVCFVSWQLCCSDTNEGVFLAWLCDRTAIKLRSQPLLGILLPKHYVFGFWAQGLMVDSVCKTVFNESVLSQNKIVIWYHRKLNSSTGICMGWWLYACMIQTK